MVDREKKISVYLDNCCYNRPYDDQSQQRVFLESISKMTIQDLIRDSHINLVSSFVSVAENMSNPFAAKRRSIKSFMDQFTSYYVSEDNIDEVEKRAQIIMQTGVKYMDACHIACAIIAGADYFLTTDKRILNYDSHGQIKIMNPADFIIKNGDEYDYKYA